jgi:small conductance mechanosensitive channel
VQQNIELVPLDAEDENHLRAMYCVRSHPEVTSFLRGAPPSDYTCHITYLRNCPPQKRFFLVRSESSFVGYCQLTDTQDHVEIGMALHPDFCNQGIGSKALASLLELLQNTGQEKSIILFVKKDNLRAIALYRKYGFERVGNENEYGEYLLTRASNIIRSQKQEVNMRHLFRALVLCVMIHTSLCADPTETLPMAAETVEVKPLNQDSEIQKRIENILHATDWFVQSSVDVKEGVVFLYGRTQTEENKKWAGTLASHTQNVVAVVNKIQVDRTAVGDFSVMTHILENHWAEFIRNIPSIFIGLIVLVVAWVLSMLSAKTTRLFMARRFQKSLLQDVIARTVAIFIFLLGVYLIFEMMNLTGAAFAIVSGTGLIGIILGIAFRDITENFLASLLLSIHHPFQPGDLIEVAGVTGYVQGLTMRVTILMALDGNHVQIPNSVVYKSHLRNYTSNSNRREDFTIPIGYHDSVSEAQEVALQVLDKHEAVLKDPEPWVLVDRLEPAKVVLRIYFWLDGSQHSSLKVRSSVIRLVKKALQERKISIPGEVREVLFPQDLSVRMVSQEVPLKPAALEPENAVRETDHALRSDAEEIKEQGKQARPPEEGKNLFDPKKKENE